MTLSNFSDGVGLGSIFVGREQELDALACELLVQDARMVTITGNYGTGKTALALTFAQRHKDAFPGGIHHVCATPWERLPDDLASRATNSTAPQLLILDELETLQPKQQYAQVAEIRRSWPSARLICIARTDDWSGPADRMLKLGNLSEGDFDQLLRIFFNVSKAGDISDLFRTLGGNPLSTKLVVDIMHYQSRTPRELLRYLHSFSHSGLVGADGRPISSGTLEEQQIIVDVALANDDLLRRVHANPQILYELTPRRFEEFVAEVLSRLNYHVTLTPASSDGGKDIYAAKKDALGSFLYVVECKKYAPGHRVGVALIRQLNGVVQAERATAGILATTSFFTRGAKEFQARISNQISLKDYVAIQEWLQNIFERGD
jgi:restriction system protein